MSAVLDGQRPGHVTFERRDGRYVLPANPLPDLPAALGDWNGGPRLAALREIVVEHARARETVRELSFYEDVADCCDAELAAASKLAAGLGDAASVYGEAAERALHFLLLSERTHHTTEEAG